MSHRERLAAAISEALLRVDDPAQWTVESLSDRIRSVVGVDEPWVTALARAATYAYPAPPYDAPAELTRFVLVVEEYAELDWFADRRGYTRAVKVLSNAPTVWVAAVHPERGSRLRSAYDRIDWG